MFDIITIGGATTDTFVETDKAKVMRVDTPTEHQGYLCFDYGEKLELDQIAYDIGGGATNAAVNFSNLGFKTGIVAKIGDDLAAQAILQRLNEKSIDSSMIINEQGGKSGFSIILTSFEGDRTVLTYRGTNSTISFNEIDMEKIRKTQWLYFASLSGDSNKILDEMAAFAEEHGIKTAFNPGSTQIKRGLKDLTKIFETAEILIMNRSEASAVTGIPNKPEEGDPLEDKNIEEMLLKIKSTCPGIVVITEGKKGVHVIDGNVRYHAPSFPVKVVSTLGAGDSFASTFVATMIKYDGDIEKAIKFASINSAQVVKSFGAQQGLLPFDEIEKILAENPDFVVRSRACN
ncbi:MAG: carbohydrate kinase family protein [Candidatus Gastranaerophilales bacterium]|nr:carbohydrate kinase family protein [Candidatus Gastranaerophilales bacterium]